MDNAEVEELTKAIDNDKHIVAEDIILDTKKEKETEKVAEEVSFPGLKRKLLDMEALEDFYKMRKEWSKFIKHAIRFLLLSQVIIVLLMGFGHYFGFSLTEFKIIILAFFIDTFLQVIGLAILVVVFLFNDSKI